MPRTQPRATSCGAPGDRSAHHWDGSVPTSWAKTLSCPDLPSPIWCSRIKEISLKYDLPIVIFGHAGDGNLHPNILFDRRDQDEWHRVEAAVGDLFAAAVELGGTLSRRTRRRHAQAALPGNGAGAVGHRGHAQHQACPRSKRHPQPGQDATTRSIAPQNQRGHHDRSNMEIGNSRIQGRKDRADDPAADDDRQQRTPLLHRKLVRRTQERDHLPLRPGLGRGPAPTKHPLYNCSDGPRTRARSCSSPTSPHPSAA